MTDSWRSVNTKIEARILCCLDQGLRLNPIARGAIVPLYKNLALQRFAIPDTETNIVANCRIFFEINPNPPNMHRMGTERRRKLG